jgi:hypothetical protein
VLRTLARGDVLRIFLPARTLFHSKVFLARRGDAARAILGSSNLTTPGFAFNTEVNVLISGTIDDPELEKLHTFIEEQWSDYCAFTPDAAWIDKYQRSFNTRPKPPRIPPPPRRSHRLSSTSLNIEWSAFVELIGAQEQRWQSQDLGLSIRKAGNSFLSEAEACQKAFSKTERFAEMPEVDRKLIGGWGDRTSGYFGNMRGAGRFKKLTLWGARQLGQALDSLPFSGSVSLEKAAACLKALLSLEGVALGCATRLLTVKRPDLFLPANSASALRIYKHFGENPTTAARYLTVLDKVWRFPWCQAPMPRHTEEQRLWRARVALLDAIFYDPT